MNSTAKKVLYIVGAVAAIVAAGYGGVFIYKKYASKKPAGCSSNEGCPAGQKCVEGKCISGCSATTDCPEGYVCLDGQCVVPEKIGACSVNSDCSSGYGCSPEGECVASGAIECVGSGENCPTDWGCYAGVCKPGCETDVECAEDQKCSLGKCIAVQE